MNNKAETFWKQLLESNPGPTANDVYNVMIQYPELRLKAWPKLLELNPGHNLISGVFQKMPELRREAVNFYIDKLHLEENILNYTLLGEDDGSVALAEGILERLEATPVTRMQRFLFRFFRSNPKSKVGKQNLTLCLIIEQISKLRARAWKELQSRYPSNTHLAAVMKNYPEAAEEAAEMVFENNPSLDDLTCIMKYVPAFRARAESVAFTQFADCQLILHVINENDLREPVRIMLFGEGAIKSTLQLWFTKVYDDLDMNLWERYLALNPDDKEMANVGASNYPTKYIPLALEELHRRGVKDQEIIEMVLPNLKLHFPDYFAEYCGLIDLSVAGKEALWIIFHHNNEVRSEDAGRELLTRFELPSNLVDKIIDRHPLLVHHARKTGKPSTNELMNSLREQNHPKSPS